MDLVDLYSDASPSEVAELGAITGSVSLNISSIQHARNLALALSKAKQAGATTAQLNTIRKAKPPAVANIAKATIPQIQRLMGMSAKQIANLKKMTAKQAAALKKATPKQVAALKRATPQQLANLKKATPQQMANLKKATAAQLARLKAATPAQRAALARATPQQMANLAKATPAQIAALKRAAQQKGVPPRAAIAQLPISATCPGAYRALAASSGVGGNAGMAMLCHIQKMVDLANTRALATSEHNAITNTQAFRRAVLKGLRQRGRC